MPLTCNIDARGKVVRLVYGAMMIVGGLVTIVLWAWGSSSWIPWTVSAVLLALGGFGLFEARAGWCVVRALGVKTPM